MLQAIYAGSGTEPALVPPESELKRAWTRSDAIRELVRGRMEVIGPITVAELAAFLGLSESEINAALLALEGEGFILRGKFRGQSLRNNIANGSGGGLAGRQSFPDHQGV